MTENILERARTRLMVVAPFFGSILLRHPMRATDAIPTAAVTNKGEILYNEEWCKNLSMPEAVFILAHETMHVVFAHLARRGNRDPKTWNIANDAIINEIIEKEMAHDAKAPDGCVRIRGAMELSSEQLYEKLLKEGTDQKLAVDDLCHGGPDGKDAAMNEEDAKTAIADAKAELAASATSAKMCGGLSAGLERIVGGFLDSKVPWHQVLERFFTGRANQHQSWSHPNKRFRRLAYLPRRERQPSMGRVIIGVDTSGSIDMDELRKYFGHLNALFEQCHPTSVTVVYCDSEVQKVEDFSPDEFPITAREIYGGGGTDLREITDWVREQCEDPDALIIFTDGFTPVPEPSDVTCPLVWVCSTNEWEGSRGEHVPGMVITDYKE